MIEPRYQRNDQAKQRNKKSSYQSVVYHGSSADLVTGGLIYEIIRISKK
jgi:hypothetical protein